jgi:hypothetical protein
MVIMMMMTPPHHELWDEAALIISISIYINHTHILYISISIYKPAP